MQTVILAIIEAIKFKHHRCVMYWKFKLAKYKGKTTIIIFCQILVYKTSLLGDKIQKSKKTNKPKNINNFKITKLKKGRLLGWQIWHMWVRKPRALKSYGWALKMISWPVKNCYCWSEMLHCSSSISYWNWPCCLDKVRTSPKSS